MRQQLTHFIRTITACSSPTYPNGDSSSPAHENSSDKALATQAQEPADFNADSDLPVETLDWNN